MVAVQTKLTYPKQNLYRNFQRPENLKLNLTIQDTFSHDAKRLSFGGGKSIPKEELNKIVNVLVKKSENELKDLEAAFTYFKDRAKGKTDHISAHEMSTIVERHLGVSAKDTKSQEQILDLFKTGSFYRRLNWRSRNIWCNQ